MNFIEAVKNHLSDYKKQELGVYENGILKRHDRPYPHILPPELWEFNLLEHYREEILTYIKENNLQLHHDFHHLNSSQAVCLNFFYPIVAEQQTELLLQLLELHHETVEEWAFDKTLFSKEGTKFDFYLKLQSGKQIFFAGKYLEQAFGRVKSIGKYRRKYEEFHKERLQGKIRSNLDEYEAFINYYRLLRKISYIDVHKDDVFIMIYPKNNKNILKQFQHLFAHVFVPELQGKIRLLTWEAIVDELNQHLLAKNAPLRLLHHYSQFADKYLI